MNIIWTITRDINGVPCSDSKTIALTNYDFELADDTERYTDCKDDYSMSGSMPNGSYDTWTGKWTSSGSASFEVEDNGTTTTSNEATTRDVKVVNLNNSIDGNRFVWTVSSTKCPDKTQKFTIYNPKPNATISDKDSYSTDKVNCNAQINLTAEKLVYPNNGEAGVWTADGNTTFSNKTSESTVATNMPNGPVNITWTVTRTYGNGQTCTTSDNIVVNNLAFVPRIITNPDKLDRCLSDVHLDAEAPGSGVKGVWTSNPPEVLAGNTDVSNAHLDVTNLPAGETIFYWTLSDDTYNPVKCDAKSTHINVVNKQYNGTPLEDQYLCEDYYTMTASTLPTTAEGEWTLVKTSDANANISSADNTNNFMHVENLGKNENTFKWTVKNYFTEADKAAHNDNYCESEQEVSLFNMSFEADANANTDSKEINICGTRK